jgi:hypothetical protein
MPTINLTPEEENIYLLIKKHKMTYHDCKRFMETFCLCIDKGVFDFGPGRKIIHFSKNKEIKKIETFRVDYPT